MDPFEYLRIHFTTDQEENKNTDEFIGDNENLSLSYAGKPKMHKCTLCFKEYVDKKSIRRHLLRIHNIDPPPGNIVHQCPECNERVFKQKLSNNSGYTCITARVLKLI